MNASVVNDSNVVLAGRRQSLLCVASTVGEIDYLSVRFWHIGYHYKVDGTGANAHDYVLVMNDSRVTIDNADEGITRLEFNPIRSSDGGEYLCRAIVNNTHPYELLYDIIHLNVTSKCSLILYCSHNKIIISCPQYPSLMSQ